ncbi:MAG: 30S ribosomal protein S20 [Planctomycetota bacterium]|mgnify:FL=1|jgi:small subunit ribosomal protein S20|nr:30S ribosomal protein S20 [Planctomycetota bacterium]MDG2143689.1 30S ribosomal protein S20 [Planctomycetota bacterium]
MPNNKQANKRVRLNETRRQENKVVRSSMRKAIRNVVEAETAEDATGALPTAMKRIDKAAKKNVIHENAAARYKSRVAGAAAAK